MGHKIVIAGAGSIGCFVGGLLAKGGAEVTFLARPRIAEEVETAGLSLTSFEGWAERVDPSVVTLATDPALAFAGARTILVTVKSGATAEMGALIAAHAPPEAAVVSLQNGLANAELLRKALPGRPVFAGMVSFNVLHRGPGQFHRGTSGPVVVEAGAPPLAAPHLDFLQHPDMGAVLAGKLLYNLNNALNALSGLTLAEQLGDRRWRRLFAAAQEEALAVFRAAGITPWSMSKVPVQRMPRMLRLPNFLFRQLSKRGVRIDRTARSSMWEDLEKRRPTEIDELQGAIIRRGAALGVPTPVNIRIAEAIRAAEQAGTGSPRLDPDQLSGGTS
ncbi:2-dehydropantoate 2-reductase [Sphingomonas astaxanthinifaciens]|uniref:2-dehydropantoate 2-reductase n=1 Tax=Sphingomonas astaxanthinifaciens DSM 22298 TaxID=1123267 RepID=A0ABQ5Z7D0_9SPHN|nr:2-dehydropantoate 2-reductase [Sphingomonas astaxanthinifaciens]GLR47916.1 2-dehydropantoate 2-reductase [Sphingomonas astaxanthinifaciens DSM 22298]